LLLVLLVSAGCEGCCKGAVLRGTASGSHAGSSHPKSGQTLRGEASYYANSLRGHPTASGEPYDPGKLTAANRTLPLGTRLRVKRLDNGKTVEVRVNDRGPFGHRQRILDLSRAAAKQLDMLGAGVVEVEAEVLP
jgi:rare lipoprotein A